jgi:signal transduction histidine kinase
MSMVRVLLIEDDPGYARLLREILGEARDAEYRVWWAATLVDGLAALERDEVDVVLLDLGLPDADGTESVKQVCSRAPRLPVVVLSGENDVDTALESMRLGVQDFLVKGRVEHALVPRAIRYAIERKRLQDFEPLLLGVVGHDLRNPLQTIAVASRLLQAESSLTPEQRAKVDHIHSASRRAASLVGDLVDLTRVRLLGKTLPIERETADLAVIVRQTIEDFRYLYGDRVVFTSQGPSTGSFDGKRIGQVVANLLRNAVDHGDGKSPISVALRGSDDAVELAVHNEGAAIPPELLPHLFEPFRRPARAADREDRGVGLGLYIVHEIADTHGGRVDVTSAQGQGTTFIVRLPRA